MSMPRCPRCKGLLVLTAQEDKPIRCVNCAGRFHYVDVTRHETRAETTWDTPREKTGSTLSVHITIRRNYTLGDSET